MIFSGNAIKRLGKALRDGPVTDQLVAQLEDYRASFDPLLIDTSLRLETILRTTGVPYLLTGRSKRTKSIIRKLRRPGNEGMDMSRMADIVGLRLIVQDLASQNQVLHELTSCLEIKDLHDFRENPPPSGYRCIHLNVRNDGQLLEIQLRTLAQHLWAIESESFGEQTKEGSPPEEVSKYLQYIRMGVESIEGGQGFPESVANPKNLAATRAPFTSTLPTLSERFQQATATDSQEQTPGSFLLVYDRNRGQLLHEFSFKAAEREQALKEYSTFSRMVDESRFDVLILNATNPTGLRVTHPQFF
jgi:ppGpp synthetase/RelA/SpoT-type nucleotidyltranferase